MVCVKVRVRPKSGYTYVNKVKTIELESHSRLEELLQKGQAGESTAGTSHAALYLHGHELPLNTSVGSHNLQDGIILETCRNPHISIALSAVLRDLDSLKKIPHPSRTAECIQQRIQTPVEYLQQEDFWSINRWNDDQLKNRIICCATMKKIVQRDDRYAIHELDHCHSIEAFHDSIQLAFQRNEEGRRWNNIGNLFRKETKKNGKPSIVYILLQEKLRLQLKVAAQFHERSSEAIDALEEFIRLDTLRHGAAVVAITPTRQRRTNHAGTNTTPPHLNINREITSTPRRRSRDYCPEYMSGPFSILCALYEAQHGRHRNSNNQRLLSLSESQLKHLAQPRCRSNFYDRQMYRGSRSAFACMEQLAKRDLCRKELIRDGEERWQLLAGGEEMAKACLEFEEAVNSVIKPLKQDLAGKDRELVNGVSLIVDSREDQLYRERINALSQDYGIGLEEKELPAGDYLFSRDGQLFPLVVERKSWSDLADSVLSKGIANRRLDCVKLGTEYSSCPRGNCQLCKMKRSGCSQIMFIIEGSRCTGRDVRKSKCTAEKRCQACRALMDRHGSTVTQDELELVLNKLQAKHGCYIHFTRNYNETITSLLAISDILRDGVCFASKMSSKVYNKDTISYHEFCANTNGSGTDNEDVTKEVASDEVLEWQSDALFNVVAKNRDDWISSLSKELGSNNAEENTVTSRKRSCSKSNVGASSKRQRSSSSDNDGEIINIDDSDDDSDSCTSVDLLHESQDSVQIIDDFPGIEENNSQDSVQIIDDLIQDSTVDESITESENRGDSAISPGTNLDKLPFLILRGYDECDDRFQKHMNIIWRNCYDERRGTTCVKENATQSLESLVNSSPFPFLPRTSVVFSLLWLQVKNGLHVRILARSFLGDDLKAKLSGTSVLASAGQLRSDDSSAKKLSEEHSNYTTQVSTQRDVSLLSANEGNDNSRQNLPSSTSLSTPKSPPRRISTSSSIPDPSSGIERSCKGGSASEVSLRRNAATSKFPSSQGRLQAIEARLRRFDRSQSECREAFDIHDSPSASQSREDAWSCHVCTYKNPFTSGVCEMCKETNQQELKHAQSGSTDHESSGNTYSHAKNIWICQACTLENPSIAPICEICQAKNPHTPFDDNCREPSANMSKERNDEWSCLDCTLKNPSDAPVCKACQANNPLVQPDSTLDHGTSSSSSNMTCTSFKTNIHEPNIWECSYCTFHNSLLAPICGGCEKQNPKVTSKNPPQQSSTSMSTRSYQPIATSSSSVANVIPGILSSSSPSSSTKKKAVTCGACGKIGHNRGTATPQTCDAYYDEAEVERREKKARKQREKAIQAEQDYKQLEREENDRLIRQERLKREMEAMQRDMERTQELNKEEIKRRKKRAEALKRRADKNL